RGPGARAVRAVPALAAPDPAHARALLDLVPGPQAALLLGAHALRRRPLRLERHRGRAARAVGGQRPPAHPHARARLALGAGPEHPLRVPVPRPPGAGGPRAHPPAGAVRLGDGGGARGLPRHRLRPRLSDRPPRGRRGERTDSTAPGSISCSATGRRTTSTGQPPSATPPPCASWATASR